MAGLFDTFTISKRGLSVQNGNINTAAHNIANASTPGYSRQRAVVETTRAFGGTSKFDCSVAGQVGTGAQITTIQRIRNEFVDYQVREANGILGNSEIKSEYLSKIEDILGETSDTGIQGLISQFYESLQSLTTAASSTNVKTVLLQNGLTLTNNLNSIYNQLEKQLSNAQEQLGTNVTEINGYLDKINELNKQISRMTALGQSPNDLMDSRDLLLDEISSKFGIEIDKKALNTIDLSSSEYSNLNLVNSDPNDTNYNRFSTVKGVTISDPVAGKYTMTVEYYVNGDTSSPSTFTITSTSKSELEELQENLEQSRILIADKDGKINIPAGVSINADGNFEKDGKLVDIKGNYIKDGYYVNASGDFVGADGVTVVTSEADKVKVTEETNIKQLIFNTSEYEAGINTVPGSSDKIKGEIAGAQSIQETIKGYMDQLDKLAASLAYTMNAIQTGTTGADLTGAASEYLIFTNGSTSNSDAGISAKNITINKSLLDNSDLVNCKPSDESGNGANDRAQAMAALNTIKFDFGSITTSSDSWTRESFLNATNVGFTGGESTTDSTLNIKLTGSTSGSTMGVYYAGIVSKIGSDSKSASEVVSNQSSILTSLENQKLSESGVSLDEEMTDLIQFQHAYQANAKMISTINDLLDVVINGLI